MPVRCTQTGLLLNFIDFCQTCKFLYVFPKNPPSPPFPKGGEGGFSLSFVSPCDMNVSFFFVPLKPLPLCAYLNSYIQSNF